MANSGGTLDLPDAHFDMVRVGLMLYGYFPSSDVQQRFTLRPAISLKAKIIQIKTLQPGDTVGYGRRYIASRKEKIAILQIGYSDGYDRRLRNIGQVLYNGEFAPIVGDLCMDACFISLEKFPDAKVGDVVTLMGCDAEAAITPHDIAKKIDTVSYDVISSYTKRLPRVYLNNNKPISFKSITTGLQELVL